MLDNWKKERLHKLGFLGRGKSKHRPRNDISLYGGKYPFVQTGDVKAANLYISEYSQTYNDKGLSQSKLWDKGTLCLTIAANIAETGILDIQACFPDSIVGFVADPEKADTKFIKYYIDTIKKQMSNVAQGATQENLSLEKIKSFDICLPESVEHQKKISGILSAYDDLIENNNKRIKLLEEISQKLYKHWFVDFKFPGHESIKMVKSELGLIPEGWRVKSFSDKFSVNNGFAFKSSDYSKEGTLLIRTKDFASSKYIDVKENVFIPDRLLSKYSKYLLEELDFLLIMVGASIGKYGVVFNKDLPALQNQNMWSIRPIYDERLRYYLIFMMPLLINKVSGFSTGAAREFFVKNVFLNQKIIMPSDSVLTEFINIVSPMVDEISVLSHKNNNLIETRDLLLPKLISGGLDVEDLEIQI